MYRAKLSVGSLNVEYSNDTLRAFFDTMIEYKKLNVFRDINIQDFFKTQSRQTTAHRRIELMMPFYIVKKLVPNWITEITDCLATDRSTSSN
jgi:hypothetical protein